MIPGGEVTEQESSPVVVDDRRDVGGLAHAVELRVHQGQRSISAQRGDRVLADQIADADGLARVIESELPLTAQPDVLKGLAIDRMAGGDADSKSLHFAVARQQRSVHVAVVQVETHSPTAFSCEEAAVPNRTRIVGVELQRRGARISRADIKGEVFDVVVKPVGRAESPAPENRLGRSRIGEDSVLQPHNRSVAVFAPQLRVAPIVPSLPFLRPGEGAADTVGAGGQEDQPVSSDLIIEGALQRFGIIGLAVAPGAIGCLGDINDEWTVRIHRGASGLEEEVRSQLREDHQGPEQPDPSTVPQRRHPHDVECIIP